jgi:hypothetical protein
MGVKTTVAQVAVVGGGLYNQPDNILVAERVSPFGKGRGRGNLYILVELSGPDLGREVVARQIVQRMRQAYYGWRGSVTAGLRQAILGANELLLEENRNSLPGERRMGGVSCAVLRDDDLFMAQAGPTAIYLRREREVSRFPDRSPWLDGFPPEEMDASALGERRELNVDLFHSQIGTGDTLLLVNSEVAKEIHPESRPEVLAQTPVSAVVEKLYAVGGRREFSALAVRIGEEAAETVQVQPPVQVQREPAPFRKVAAPPIALQGPSPEDVAAVGEQVERTRVRTPRAPVEAAAVVGKPEERWPDDQMEEVEPGWKQLPERVTQFQIGARLGAMAQAVTAALAGLWLGLLSLFKRLVPERSRSQPREEGRSTVVGRTSMKRSQRQSARTAASMRSDPLQKLLAGVAIAIPVIVAIIVLVSWAQRGQAQRVEVETLWSQANSHWQQAQTVTDLKAARTYLEEADRQLGLLIESKPDHTEAIELQKKVQSRLDVINQVKRISWVGVLNTYPADADLSRVVIQGAHIFVMDRRNGKVYHHKLDEQLQNALDPTTAGTVLVNTGDHIGSVLVGDLVDMVWMPVGPGRQKASLLILESGGALLDYDPATGQLLPLRVAGSEMWQYPKLVGSHSGRFYLLDSSANKIWRYDPTSEGYTNSPEDWLKAETDLAGVVDMAIGDSIYLLYVDGGMRAFKTGNPEPFDISGWDTPPSNPSAIFTRPPEETRWLYVADRGNERIVQSSKDGQMKQQYRLADNQATENGDALAGATSLFVDEIVGHAYLLSGQKLYLLVLPLSN